MAAIYVKCCLINCLYMYRYKSFFLACAAVTPCYELFFSTESCVCLQTKDSHVENYRRLGSDVSH